MNTVSSVAQLLSAVQQAATELQDLMVVRHAFNGITASKQADINAPDLGTVWHDQGVTRRKTDQRRRALLVEATRVIRERHGEFDLSLADIAEDAGCSTRQLQRVFRELADTDFRSALLRVRMERAHRLLSRKQTDLTVRQAARAVGYREASGLRQQFTRFYGCNPSEIRPAGPDYDDLWRAVENPDN